MQYRMTDLAYCQMLMQKAGIYSYIVEGEYGDEVVFGDDIDHYICDNPQRLVPYREAAVLEAGGGMQFAAQDSINAVAGKNADWSVVKRFTVTAGERISLFAQKLGIKIFAAKGPVEIQAQGGPYFALCFGRM